MFAILKQRAEIGEAILELPDGATISDAMDEAGKKWPVVAEMSPGVATALNLAYVPRDTVLRDGDELALIPPVSGG